MCVYVHVCVCLYVYVCRACLYTSLHVNYLFCTAGQRQMQLVVYVAGCLILLAFSISATVITIFSVRLDRDIASHQQIVEQYDL